MRNLVMLASLAVAAGGCRDTTEPAELSPAAASADARIDLRPVRASLISAGNAVSDAIGRKGVAAGLTGAMNQNALLLSPRKATIQGRSEAAAFLASGDPLAPSAMQWKVIVADVSNDATQGYTWAQGKYTIDLGAGATEVPGFFLAYWKRSQGGGWKLDVFVLNQGGPAATAPAAGLRDAGPQVRPQGTGHRSQGPAEAAARDGQGLLRRLPGERHRSRVPAVRRPERDRGQRAVRLRARGDRRSLRQRAGRRGELGPPLRRRRAQRRSRLHRRRRGVRPGLLRHLLHQVPVGVAEAGQRRMAVRGRLRQRPAGALRPRPGCRKPALGRLTGHGFPRRAADGR